MLTQIVATLIEHTAHLYNQELCDLSSHTQLFDESNDISALPTQDRQSISQQTEASLLEKINRLFEIVPWGSLEGIDHYLICNDQKPLETLVRLNWLSVVELLLGRRDVDVNIRLCDGKTLLMLVSEGDYLKGNKINPDSLEVKMVRLLLEYGADVHKKTEKGTTALHYAAKGSTKAHTEAVRLLLDYGADPNVRTNECLTNSVFNATPLHWANRVSENVHSVRVLLEKGAIIYSEMCVHNSRIQFLKDLGEIDIYGKYQGSYNSVSSKFR